MGPEPGRPDGDTPLLSQNDPHPPQGRGGRRRALAGDRCHDGPVTLARDERLALCTTLLEVGPQAPTLCEGWDAHDLAVHLVLRDRRPDASAAFAVSAAPLPGTSAVRRYADHVRNQIGAQDWASLVQEVRSGVPPWHPARLGVVDEQVNLAEFFVHHEDLRRARPGWLPRPTPQLTVPLWRACRTAGRLALRRAPVGVELVAPGLGHSRVHKARRGQSSHHSPGDQSDQLVRVEGEPGELLLFAFGRRSAAQVRLDGPQAAVEALRASRSGI